MATLRPADMVDTFLVLFLVMVAVQSSLFLLKVLKFLVLRFLLHPAFPRSAVHVARVLLKRG